MPTREEWLQERKKGIGGSDAAAIVGMNPYKTNVQLWKEKTGMVEAEDISEKPFVKYGTLAEEHLRAIFALDYPIYEVEHEENSIIKHPKYDFLFASLDGKLRNKETGELGILEIKTSNILTSQHKEKWDNRIPQNYYIQILHYMLVTGRTFAILKAQLRYELPNNEIYHQTKHYYIKKEDVEDDINYLLGEEIKFWEYVQSKKEPPLKLPSV